jgi:endonuclease/exonuclease/phosphatase family metal-dependent hydrolase
VKISQDAQSIKTNKNEAGSSARLHDTTAAAPAAEPKATLATQQAADGTKVKVLTINVKGFQTSDAGDAETLAFDAIEKYIEKIDADVVLFQELDTGTERGHGVDQLAEIARRTDATDSQFAQAIEFQGGGYGVGIMTRNGFNIRDAAGGGNDTRTVKLPRKEGGGADKEDRVALVAPIVAPDGGEFTAVTTHLANKGPGRGAQVDKLDDIVEDLRGGADNSAAGLPDTYSKRVVLGGDFNTQRGPVEEHLGDQVTHVGEYDTGLGDTNIDHIYVSDDVHVVDAQLDEAELLDTSPLPGDGPGNVGDDRSTDHPALQTTVELR